MENADILGIIELYEGIFRGEEDIKKSITEVIEKHHSVTVELALFKETIEKTERTYNFFKFFRFPISNQISEFYNALEVYKGVNEERLLTLENMGIYLEVMFRNQENKDEVNPEQQEKQNNIDHEEIIRERTIKTLSLYYPYLHFIEMENNNNYLLLQSQLDAMKEHKPFILGISDVDRKRFIGNGIDEIRKILNNS